MVLKVRLQREVKIDAVLGRSSIADEGVLMYVEESKRRPDNEMCDLSKRMYLENYIEEDSLNI